MIKLSTLPREPYWLDPGIPGLRLQVRPITPVMVILAQREAARLFDEDRAAEDPTTTTRVGVALIRALARAGIAGWEGVGGEGEEPAGVTEENVEKLLDIWPVHDALDRLYVTPALRIAAEGNGSAVSPNGTGGTAATSTAGPAR